MPEKLKYPKVAEILVAQQTQDLYLMAHEKMEVQKTCYAPHVSDSQHALYLSVCAGRVYHDWRMELRRQMATGEEMIVKYCECVEI